MYESRKKDIRKMILSQRNKISLKERQKKSGVILKRLIQTSYFLKAFTMMIYVSFSSEVMTEKLINYALRKEKKIAVPTVDLAGHQLILSEIKHYEELVPSTYGIKEPKQLRIINPDQVELFILPGLAFDEQGTRLGYGGGYFDRLLSTKNTSQNLIGIAYELQIQKELPCTHHDISVNKVITEKKVRTFNI